MATRKAPVLEEENGIDEELERELQEIEGKGAEDDRVFSSGLTGAVPKKKSRYEGPVVSIFLPEIEGSDTEGLEIDQYEHVSIANEKGEEIWHVRRGVSQEVPVPVFVALKERYPKL